MEELIYAIAYKMKTCSSDVIGRGTDVNYQTMPVYIGPFRQSRDYADRRDCNHHLIDIRQEEEQRLYRPRGVCKGASV